MPEVLIETLGLSKIFHRDPCAGGHYAEGALRRLHKPDGSLRIG